MNKTINMSNGKADNNENRPQKTQDKESQDNEEID